MENRQINEVSFFERYNRILLVTLSLVSAVVLGLFWIQFEASYRYNKQQLINDFESRATILNTTLTNAYNRVTTLQTAAQDYLKNHSQQDFQPSLLFSSLIPAQEPGFYIQGAVPKPLQSVDSGSVLGKGSLSDLNLEQKQELELGFSLNPIFRSIVRELPSVAWVYYLSNAHFMNAYPPGASDFLKFSDAFYSYAFYKQALPDADPTRTAFWTSAYIDAGGKGLMVTGSAPVYAGDKMHGVVALDFTLGVLSQFVTSLTLQGRSQPNLFIVGRDEQLLAHPQLITAQDQAVQSAQLALPDALVGRLAEIHNLAPGQFHRLGGYWLIRQDLQDVPWELIFWLQPYELMIATLAGTNVVFLVLLPGLGVIVAISNRLTRKEFIRPAELLVAHLVQEQTATATLPDEIPPAWQPWFERISESFAQNRQLLTQLSEANLTLESKVEERTVQLSQTSQELAEKNRELSETLADLIKTQAQLIQTEKISSLGQMVAGIAHEFNNPLGFITGNLRHAQEYTDHLNHLISLYQQHYPQPHADISRAAEEMDLEFIQDDLGELFQSMWSGANRIKVMVNSLRTFSRLDESELKFIDLHESIESVLTLLAMRLKPQKNRSDITVVRNYGQIPPLQCYASELNQVFFNILTNAVDAIDSNAENSASNSPEAGEIKITTQISGEQVMIRISDSGIGMDETTQAKIFDPFFTTKAIGDGPGLGLAIAHQVITKRHNGSISVASAIGKGTTFFIELPLSVHPPIKGNRAR